MNNFFFLKVNDVIQIFYLFILFFSCQEIFMKILTSLSNVAVKGICPLLGDSSSYILRITSLGYAAYVGGAKRCYLCLGEKFTTLKADKRILFIKRLKLGSESGH